MVAVMPSPKSRVELARQHLDRALDRLDSDEEAAALWLFYAAEQAVESLASSRGLGTKKNHQLRIKAAKELADNDVVADTTADLLDTLNEARKETTYEGERLNLRSWSLADAAEAVETLVQV